MLRVFFLLFLYIPLAEATQCIGYFLDGKSIGVSDQWGDRGDQFTRLDMDGNISWPSGNHSAWYKSQTSLDLTPTTYSIALPKKVYLGTVPLDVSVPGKTAFDAPLSPKHNIYAIFDKQEGCRSFPGWSKVDDTWLAGGAIRIKLQGTGLPSGNYQVRIPYTIAWGTDGNQSEAGRVQGTWSEVNPASSTTGEFFVSFEIKNNCDLLDYSDVNLNHGILTPPSIKGNIKKVSRQIKCLSATNVKISLSPKKLDFKNGVNASLKIKNGQGDEITELKSVGTVPVQFDVESTLDTNNTIVAGTFSGHSILSITYQ